MEQRAIATFIGMFSPTQSPFYAVVFAGLIALGYVVTQDLEWIDARYLAYPIYPLIVMFAFAAFFHKVQFTQAGHNFQLVYARTIGLIAFIAATTVLVANNYNFEEVPLCVVPVFGELPERICGALTSFETLYVQCAIAGAAFLSLSVVKSAQRERECVVNFTQIALIMSAFLGSGIYFATIAAQRSGDIGDMPITEVDPNIALLFAAGSLGMWWIVLLVSFVFLAVSTAFGIATVTAEKPDGS